MGIKDKPLKNPAIPRAPAGMETDPETGDVHPNDTLKGLKSPKKAEFPIYKVSFPNMEMRPYSVRPHFAHDWFRQMKTAVIREGGELLSGDKKAQFITVSFRTPRAAQEFIRALNANHYVPQRDIRSYVEKQAVTFDDLRQQHDLVGQNPTAVQLDEVIERAIQHVDSPALQTWLEQNQLISRELESAVRENSQLAKSLHGAVLEAEKDIRAKDQPMTQPKAEEGSGKLMFDPSQYVKQSGKQPVFKRLNVKTATTEAFYEGDTVLVDMGDEMVEGQVKTTSPTTAMVAYLQDGEHEFVNVPKECLSKILAVRIPMERFPKQALAVEHRCRLTNGQYVKVSSVNGRPGYTKVALLNNQEVRWVPDDQLEVVARVARFPETEDKEWV